MTLQICNNKDPSMLDSHAFRFISRHSKINAALFEAVGTQTEDSEEMFTVVVLCLDAVGTKTEDSEEMFTVVLWIFSSLS